MNETVPELVQQFREMFLVYQSHLRGRFIPVVEFREAHNDCTSV